MREPEIGELDRRVALKRISRGASDGQGGYAADSETTTATVWGKFFALSSNMRREADSKREERTHEITIRYRSDLLINDKAVVGGVDYRVVGLVPIARRWLVLEVAPWVVAT